MLKESLKNILKQRIENI